MNAVAHDPTRRRRAAIGHKLCQELRRYPLTLTNATDAESQGLQTLADAHQHPGQDLIKWTAPFTAPRAI